jgi:hypothetical protein
MLKFKLINSFNNYSKSILRKLVPSYVGMLRVKAGRPLVNHMINMVLLVKGSMETSLVKVIITYVRFLHYLIKQNGPAFTAKYLKASVSLLMQAISGDAHKSSHSLGVAVSRTNRGLPRFIPKIHRNHIRMGNTFYIRLWLTLISVYRVLDFTGKVSLKTITNGSKAVINFNEVGWAVIDLKMKDYLSLDNKKGGVLTPFWIASSSPTSTKTFRDGSSVKLPSSFSTSIGSIINAVFAWAAHPDLARDWIKFAKLYGFSGPVVSFMEYVLGCRGSFKLPYLLTLYDNKYKDVLAQKLYNQESYLGKLAFKEEAAGKVRVFAMADPFTQWLLKPMHESIFAYLATLKCDATFNQVPIVTAFATRLQSENIKNVYSFDLTAATDRIPLSVQSYIVTHAFWKHGLGEAWANLLVNRWYSVPFPQWDPSAILAKRLKFDLKELPSNVGILRHEWKGRNQSFVRTVKYGTGQPMGALSSWAMLAMTHHVMVAIAARRVNKVGFDLYLVLGDDLVIADTSVADSYLQLAKEWDIDINLSKSVISTNGSFEFAKRFFYQYKDVSGLSFKEMAVAKWDVRALLQLFHRIATFRNIRISELLSFLGHGYKALSRINAKYTRVSNSMRKVLLLASYPDLNLFNNYKSFYNYEEWIGSIGFFRKSTVTFTRDHKKIFWDTLVKEVGSFPRYSLPTGTGLHEIIIKHLNYIYTGPDPKDPENFMVRFDKDFLRKEPLRNPLHKRAEPYNEFIMQLNWVMKPMFDILFNHFNNITIETRTEFRASNRSYIDMDISNMWMRYDQILDVKSKISALTEYRIIKEVQTLGSSKLIKNVSTLRSNFKQFSNENKVLHSK